MSQIKYLTSNLKNILQNERFISRNMVCVRFLTSKKQNSLSVSSNKDNGQVSKHVKVSERIKQTGKDVTNLAVILAGIGIAGGVAWVIFKEFFSSKSPSSIFASALNKCKQDDRIVELLGEPIKGHGEMTRRGRARHVSHTEYERKGRTHIQVKFYLKGPTGKTATVQCETTKDSPSSSFRYIFVKMDQFPNGIIFVEDNRLLDEK